MQENTIFDDSLSKKIQEARRDRPRPILTALEGMDVKNRYPIDRPEMILGRDLSCDVVLTDSKSSRRHALILHTNFNDASAEPKVRVKDLGSTNGTFVNGLRITDQELRDRDKIMIGQTLLGFFLRDESALKAEQKLIQLASIDQLTGLNNRGVFDLEIAKEFDRARRYSRELSLVLFDIDHFKRFNDTYGHQTGDAVLREVGTIVQACTRTSDVSARYGGEEFAIILPETSMENALIQAERLRRSVQAHAISSRDTKLGVTVSVGVAAHVPSMREPEDLINAADKALYRAKQAGRNQVCWSGAPPTDPGNLDQTSG